MRKFVIFIVLIGSLIAFQSAFNAESIDSKVGSFAPNMTVADNDSTFTLTNYRGKYVILNFWSSDDAESRIRNISLNNFINKHKDDKVVFASVNFDRSEKLFKEIVNVDNLDDKAHFFDKNGKSSEVFENFELKNGLKCFVINPEGKIIKVNPEEQQLINL